MLRKTMLCAFLVIMTSGYGQTLRDAINNNSLDASSRLVPKVMNYQGYLTDTLGIPIDDTLDMTFKIFDDVSAGMEWWSETQSNIPIKEGIFHVILGNNIPIPDSVFFDGTNRWLELILEGPVILAPRTRVTSSGYAYMATYSDTAEYARTMGADNDWSVTDSVLYTDNYWGIARGGVNNVLHGTYTYSHLNFGIVCTTGHSVLNERYCTVGGGYGNAAIREYTTVSGGYSNRAFYDGATVGGGYDNLANGDYSTVAGGRYNTANGDNAAVTGGYNNNAARDNSFIGGGGDNLVEGAFSVIAGGYADTITSDAHYSYLFGIGSKLKADSTFMVDMPHIWFGDETNGYEFPVVDGSIDQVMVTDGSGQVSWSDVPSDTDWVISANDMYSNITGNVGIGTATPDYKLDVAGSAGFNDTIYHNDDDDTYFYFSSDQVDLYAGNVQMITADETTQDILVINENSNDVDFRVESDNDENALFVQGSNGNVGIGMVSPLEKLDVDGTVQVTGFKMPTGALNSHILTSDALGSGTWQAVPDDNDWVISGSNQYSAVTGNVGIGTATPDYKLDVAGSAGFNDTIYHNDDDDTYFYFSSDQIDLYAGNVQMITADETTQDILVINENSNDVDFRVESDNDENALFVQGSNGNVGIGMASPLEKLDVDGTVQVTGFKMPTGALNSHILTSDALGSGTWQAVPDDNDWIRSTPDSVLFTAHALGIARGGVGNIMYGSQVCRHTNLGAYQCTTGVSGQNYSYITICGGNGNRADSAYSAVVSGSDNKARGRYSFVGGGISNIAGSYSSFIGGGAYNETSSSYAIVVGGYSNAASGYRSFIGGGFSNETNSQYTSICGGRDNTADGDYSIIGGGYSNATFAAPYTAILSGYSHAAGEASDDTAAVVVGGYNNSALEGFAFVGGGKDNIADGKFATICGGYSHEANGYASSVLSGYNNSANSNADTATVIAGGWGNDANRFSFIGGGKNNTAWNYSTVSGGEDNIASWNYSTISGGSNNEATRDYTTVGGGRDNNAYYDYTTVCGGRENRAHYDYATVCGGYQDTVHAYYGGILSGYRNLAGDEYEDTAAVVVCGKYNSAEAKYAFIGCGRSDTVRAIYGVVVSGYSNMGGDTWTGQDTAAVVVGGWNNAATGKFSFIGGGKNNTAWNYGTVSGGRSNRAEDAYATVAGGYADTSSGMYSFTTNYNSVVPVGCQHSAAFTGQTATAMSQVRAWQFSSAMGGGFSIDHPQDPMNKILSHRFVESPEMVLIYRGIVYIEANGRVEVHLPDYFDVLNKNPMVQLTGVGTSDVFVAQEVDGNRFVVGGKPKTKVYWTVTGERKDQSAEIGQILVPVEQKKKGYLTGYSLDDDGLAVVKMDLEQLGKAGEFHFKTQAGREKYSNLKQKTQELNSGVIKQ